MSAIVRRPSVNGRIEFVSIDVKNRAYARGSSARNYVNKFLYHEKFVNYHGFYCRLRDGVIKSTPFPQG